MVRKHILFSGRVQGVGFRYQAAWRARGLKLTGWVRNRSDGRVEMEVQGEENEISDLLACLQTDSFIRIDHMDMEEYPLKEGETKFQMRYTCE
jgi:acylphosphatase